MRAIIRLIIMCGLIAALTACQPQSEPIEATTQATATVTVNAPATDAPTESPTLAASATPDATSDPDQPTSTPRSSLPSLDDPTETPQFTPMPTQRIDPEVKLVQDMAEYLAALCAGDLDAREPDDESLLWPRNISPDGQLIVFTIPVEDEDYRFTYDLWVMNTDGTNLRFLMNGDTLWSLSWIPGTHRFVFNTGPQEYGGSYNDLHVVNADTGEYRMILPPTGSGAPSSPDSGGGLTPSPDGRHIAMVTATSVSIIGVDGGNYQQDVLIYDSVVTYSEYNVFARPVWSADSSGIWIAVPPLFEEAFIEVYFASLCCGLRQAGRFQMAREDNGEMGIVNGVVASPTGEYVMYNLSGDLHMARTDGTEDIEYFPDGTHSLQWIDATHFTFWSGFQPYTGEIGAEPQPIEAGYGCIPEA